MTETELPNNLPDDDPQFRKLVEEGKLTEDGAVIVAMPWTGDWSEYLPGTQVVKCRICDGDCCVSPEARAIPGYQPVCLSCARQYLPTDARPATLRATAERAEQMGFTPFIQQFLERGATMADVFAAMDAVEAEGGWTPQNPRPRFHGWGKA